MKKEYWIVLVLLVLGLITFGVSKLVGSNEKLSRAYDELFIKYGAMFGIDPKTLKAIALNESSLGKNKGYEPIGGTTGLMQIKLSTAKDFFPSLTAADLEKDDNQVKAAAAFLASLKKQFPGDEKKLVMSYNQGAGNTRAGKEYALGYWEKYLKNKALVA